MTVKTELKIGDSVMINEGVEDSLYWKYNMGGWQGRIYNKYTDGDEEIILFIEIEFDSITLNQLPEEFISDYLSCDSDYATMNLSVDDVVLTKPRDTKKETKTARLKINNKFEYISELDDDKFKWYRRFKRKSRKDSSGLVINDITDFMELLSSKSRDELTDYFRLQFQKEKKQKRKVI